MVNPTTFLLSYPRSGNHLVRGVLEFMLKIPTLGCENNEKGDQPLCERNDEAKNFFQIESGVNMENWTEIIRKAHKPNEISTDQETKMIFLVRDPLECILSHHKLIKMIDVEWYESLLKEYEKWPYEKIHFFYEDWIINPNDQIVKLGHFFNVSDDQIKETVKWYPKIQEITKKCLVRKASTSHNPNYYKEQKKATIPNNLQRLYEKYTLLKKYVQ